MSALRWRRMGTAYRLTDPYSTLYIKRVGREFHLLYRTTNPLQRIWLTLGTHHTLRDAQAQGLTLMGGAE